MSSRGLPPRRRSKRTPAAGGHTTICSEFSVMQDMYEGLIRQHAVSARRHASFEVQIDKEIEVARHGNFLVLLLVGFLSGLLVGFFVDRTRK